LIEQCWENKSFAPAPACGLNIIIILLYFH
jgi:hypothetical protein